MGAERFYSYFEQFGLLNKTGIDLPYVLHREFLQCHTPQVFVAVVLVISLLALTKQPAQLGDRECLRTLRVQASYCLVPAFFLQGY